MKITGKKYGTEHLNAVLSNYELASKMPCSVFDVPEMVSEIYKLSDKTDQARKITQLEERLASDEEGKLYKSIDASTGEIFLIQNPISRERIIKDGKHYIQIFRPKKMGNYEQIKNNKTYREITSDEWGV